MQLVNFTLGFIILVYPLLTHLNEKSSLLELLKSLILDALPSTG
jgi:hypothetical protein